jgi:hypothetical protein
MATEGFYTKPYEEMGAVQDKHTKVLSDLEEIEEKWLKATEG